MRKQIPFVSVGRADFKIQHLPFEFVAHQFGFFFAKAGN